MRFVLLLLPTIAAFAPGRKPSSHSTALSETAWSPVRFVQQSSKFIPMPFTQAPRQVVTPGTTLWEPTSKAFQFAPLDDVVMGGVSSSGFRKGGVWSGRVTDENNGGFIGIRNTPYVQWDMAGCKGIELKVSSTTPGRFKMGLRDSTEFNGIVWNASFDVGRRSQTIRIPFAKLRATKFAGTVDGQVFDSSNVVGIQLIYSKFEYDGALNPNFRVGDVNLQIESIRAY